MKHYFLLASALILPAFQAHASNGVCESKLTIGAWNIEWLGSTQRDHVGRQLPADIASYIKASKVDVLAMSEISVTRSSTGEAVNAQLDEAFALLNDQGSTWQYKLFEKHPKASSPDDQWTGLAWNSKQVQLTGGPWNVAGIDEQRRVELMGADSKKVPLNRTPYAVKLSAGQGKSDFLFVPLHLKANGGKGTELQRELEVHLILKGLESVRSQEAEDDVILMGDTNMLSTHEPGARLLKSKGMRDCNSSEQATWLTTDERFTDAPFDRIFVMSDQPETRGSCVMETADPSMAFDVVTPGDWIPDLSAQAFRQRLSDHQMIRTSLCIGPDDD
ncbi:endonuclease/exonuclease/phosphatase family protein [Pseudomonas sp.]|uniref:endonuclease/exonuclease/phosphatase family protein n=1 Tax=Pseudomonas sp. TaxID=306 RepID=UPI0028A936F2|nr:endonuclease/exonuclease/phosphatase family protein [Pseudomonas sp.]